MELANVNIKYKDQYGKTIDSRCYVREPVDENEPPTRTRHQQEQRKPITNKTRRVENNQQQQNIEHNENKIVNDNENDDNLPTKQRIHRQCVFRSCNSSDANTNRKIRWRRVPSGQAVDTLPIKKNTDKKLFERQSFRIQCDRRIGSNSL
jgi:hypothetical protein